MPSCKVVPEVLAANLPKHVAPITKPLTHRHPRPLRVPVSTADELHCDLCRCESHVRLKSCLAVRIK
jgi:hypothetical protein